MADQSPFSNFFSPKEMTQFFENFKSTPFDIQSLLETQRKNMQAVSEAQQVTVENLQAIAQRQGEFFSQLVEENSNMAKAFMGEGTPEEKIAKQADLFKKLYERNVKNMDDLASMVTSCNQEASKIINKRVSASITEIKNSLEKTQQQRKAAA